MRANRRVPNQVGDATTVPLVSTGVGRGQKLGAALVGWAFRLYTGLQVRGARNVPLSGPVIIAANHRSMLDVPLTVLASPRHVVFMAKKELFRFPPLGWLWDWLGGFPVRRDITDMRALETGRAILEAGHCLGLYPEGTRSKTGEMLPFLRGTAWLALRTGATIVPCGIRGTERRRGLRKLLPMRVRIAFGAPIPVAVEPDPRARRERSGAINAELLDAVTRLAS
jgi:1-acyl-sn-glycerol-3-phosphate acyltransferase